MNAPSPLWYTTRGAGMVLLLLVTLAVVLGILTTKRWTPARLPRFVTGRLHRSLSLLVLVFLSLHVLTAILDSFAKLGLKDALIPFSSSYRPLWLGLGVLAAELYLAVVITSLLRKRLGYRLWRLTHWLAYASWPLALVHGLGTGSDAKAGWSLALSAGCLVSVLGALGWRLLVGKPQSEPIRLAAIAATAIATLVFLTWAVSGPLRPGWAQAAGTPADLLGTAQGLSPGLRDQLQGSLTQDGNGIRIDFRDVPDSSLGLVVRVLDAQASTATVEVRRNGQTICSSSGAVGSQISVSCGATRLTLDNLQRDGSQVEGMLITSAQ